VKRLTQRVLRSFATSMSKLLVNSKRIPESDVSDSGRKYLHNHWLRFEAASTAPFTVSEAALLTRSPERRASKATQSLEGSGRPPYLSWSQVQTMVLRRSCLDSVLGSVAFGAAITASPEFFR
jgi:hypothetical protein